MKQLEFLERQLECAKGVIRRLQSENQALLKMLFQGEPFEPSIINVENENQLSRHVFTVPVSTLVDFHKCGELAIRRLYPDMAFAITLRYVSKDGQEVKLDYRINELPLRLSTQREMVFKILCDYVEREITPVAEYNLRRFLEG